MIRLLNNFNKQTFDLRKIISYLFTSMFITLSISVIGFIIYKSVYFFETNGVEGLKYIIDSKWKPSNDKNFGILNFLISTFWTILFSLLLVIKFNLFSSIFISKFLNKKIKNIVLFILRVLSGIPSVLFGVFVLFSIGPLLKLIPNGDSTSMLSAIIVLTMMTLPTTISLTVNLLDGMSKSHEFSGLALGINKVTVMFDIVKKVSARTIKVILFFGFCKIIGEVSAVTMVSGGGTLAPMFNKGFSGFFFASIRTLSTIIGLEFKENFNKLHESSLFSISLLLLIIVFVSNLLFTFINNRTINGTFINKINKIKLFSKTKYISRFKNKQLPIIKYYKNYLSIYYRKINMYLSMLFILVIFGWLLGDILVKGMIGFYKYDFSSSSVISGEDGILGILFSTSILIVATLIITIPLALFTAIFLSEYSFKSKILKQFSKFIKFIVFQLASTPTILFGMFGLTLFVTIFGFGFTIIAGAFTMILIIFPVMIQIILQNFENIPNTYRYSGYALGLSQKVVIWKIIVPMAIKGILISIILGINKIIAESAPLLIVMGNSTFEPNRGVFSDTRTLATHIALMSSESPLNLENTQHIVYQTAIIILILATLLNLFVNKLNKMKGSKIDI